MDMSQLTQVGPCQWQSRKQADMLVPVVIFGDRELVAAMDDKVLEQARNVATLPGIVGASYVLPDAHWGYGFPIGGVAGFDPEQGGIVSAGGVGFDISCGVRTLLTGIRGQDIRERRDEIADALFQAVPVGMGRGGMIHVDMPVLDACLRDGARWAVDRGFGMTEDLSRIEENGRVKDAEPGYVSEKAKLRQSDEMGTLGSGNHYLEIQEVSEIHDRETASAFGLAEGEVVITIHCGSRGLGHQVGADYLAEMVRVAPHYGIHLPDRELACVPAKSEIGRRYLGAMRAASNCALANRQIIAHIVRGVFARLFPGANLKLLFDVSHNTCKEEEHIIKGQVRTLMVHRKGATRALGALAPSLPAEFRQAGQPVLVGGSMGTRSYVLAGQRSAEPGAFASACHGAGREMSRHAALRTWNGRKVVDDLKAQGVTIRSPSMRGVAEEAPGAYKDVAKVVDSAERAGLARKVAGLKPLICIKG